MGMCLPDPQRLLGFALIGNRRARRPSITGSHLAQLPGGAHLGRCHTRQNRSSQSSRRAENRGRAASRYPAVVLPLYGVHHFVKPPRPSLFRSSWPSLPGLSPLGALHRAQNDRQQEQTASLYSALLDTSSANVRAQDKNRARCPHSR